MKPITLLGYMGCGKSTIAKKLAKRLGVACIDLDDYIEAQEQKTIATIFKNHGAIYFRKIESQYLQELLENQQYGIVALGGGTPCFGDNLSIINTHSESCYLKASVRILKNRLEKEQAKRPLIADIPKEELAAFIAKHLFERSRYYEQGKHIITIDGKKVNEVVDEVVFLVNKGLSG